MYKLRAFAFWILKKISIDFFRGKAVYFFSGVRRSGNHACIDWIANAIARKQTSMEKTNGYLTTKDKKIIFLNEINFNGEFAYFTLLREAKEDIKRGKRDISVGGRLCTWRKRLLRSGSRREDLHHKIGSQYSSVENHIQC